MNAPGQHRQPLLGWPDSHRRALAVHAWVAFALLGSCPPAICAALPDLTPAELAAGMRRGAEGLESLSVEQRAVQKPPAQRGSGQAASGSPDRIAVTEHRVLYKMKHHFAMEYSHRVDVMPAAAVRREREAAYDGKLYTWLQGDQGSISSLPSGPYNGMSYLYLRLLYYPSQEESYADYLVPPSIWRVDFEAPTTVEGHPCYVVLLHAEPPGRRERPAPSLCWRLVVCPRFGFATVDRRITYTSAEGAEERRGTTFRRFTEVVPGIWLPLGFESWSDDGPTVEVEYRYESVNQPIGDADFVVRFPPGTIVSDERDSTRAIGVPK